MLSAHTLEQIDALGGRFQLARPFRHVVVDGFLEPEVAESMLRAFPGFDSRFALNEMGEVGGKAVRTRVRELGPVYAQLDDYLQTPQFLDAVSRITGIPDLLYDPDYEGGGAHENRHGQGLDQHIDFNYHPRTGWHRRLNLIVYLNERWDDSWGGALELMEDPWTGRGQRCVVAPLFNRAVVFETTEHSWHGFEPIRLPESERARSRKSFAIYLYSRERPPELTAPPHATVYVPAALPDSVRAGTTLDEALVEQIRATHAGARAQLRFLYQRELDFNAQIERLKQALAEAQQAQRSPIEGFARTDSVEGCWPDGWFGSRASIDFTPTRSVRSIEAAFWAPPAISEQVVAVSWGGGAVEVRLRAGQRHQIRLPLAAKAGVPVKLVLRAEDTWMPSSDGVSGDQRPLAYRVLGMTLDHG